MVSAHNESSFGSPLQRRGVVWLNLLAVLILAFVAVPSCPGSSETPSITAPACGNAVVEADEECDDGGRCIGSANSGTYCTSAVQCPGGECNTFGGDGCAANCTLESTVPFPLVPGVVSFLRIVTGSGTVVQGDLLSFPIPYEGQLALTIGRERGGQIPFAIRARSVQLPPTYAGSGELCACLRGIALKTCGGRRQEADGVTPAVDCTPGYTAGDSICAGKAPCTSVFGDDNAGAGVIGCNGLDGVDVTVTQDAGGSSGMPGPAVVTLAGSGGPGSAVLYFTSAIGLEIFCGRDFCTDSDPRDVRGTPITSQYVTGTATATLTNANMMDGATIGPFSASGARFDCAALTATPASPARAALVGAFTALAQPTLGDVVIVNQFFGHPLCFGDCRNDGEVTVDDILTLVNVALGEYQYFECPAGDDNRDGQITVDEIIRAVNVALNGCG